MEIENRGLPIHADATLKIRPRIFLEGNWFVELQPGSPSAKTLSSGATIPITQTSDPVQLDQVLDALNTDTRANLQNFLAGYGDALTRKPTAAENAEQDPDVYGLNAAQALNKSYHRGALGPARLGDRQPGGRAASKRTTSRKLVASIGKVTAALNVHEQDLSELIGNFNIFFHSFAVQSHEPRRHGRGAAELAAQHRSRLHARSTRRSRSTRAFALDLIPGVKLLPATITHGAAVDRTGAGLACAERARRRRQGPARGHAGARQAVQRTARVLQADRSVQQVPDESLLPGRERQAAGRAEHLGRRKRTRSSSPR